VIRQTFEFEAKDDPESMSNQSENLLLVIGLTFNYRSATLSSVTSRITDTN
jgi:hypothetical protein